MTTVTSTAHQPQGCHDSRNPTTPTTAMTTIVAISRRCARRRAWSWVSGSGTRPGSQTPRPVGYGGRHPIDPIGRNTAYVHEYFDRAGHDRARRAELGQRERRRGRGGSPHIRPAPREGLLRDPAE